MTSAGTPRSGRLSRLVFRTLGVAVGILAILGVASAGLHFASAPFNPAFTRHPWITGTHVVLGGIYLALAPFQFVRRIRDRFLTYHRWAGRVLASMGILVGGSALFLGLVIPLGGNPERVVIGAFGGFFLLALLLGVTRVRQGRIDEHREWMIRAFAVGLSIATMRLLLLPALMIADNASDQQVIWIFVSAFMAAFAAHLVVAELLVRKTRRRPAPSSQPAKPVAV
jgi:uncharacterized membrane protein